MSKLFAKETDLVAAFCGCLASPRHARIAGGGDDAWRQYHETAGWDLLLVHAGTGLQIGIEAKLSLNAKVLTQALPSRYHDHIGPDYRAVLVPPDGCQAHMAVLAGWLGVTVLMLRLEDTYDVRGGQMTKGQAWRFDMQLPTQRGEDWTDRGWFPWLPTKQCALPDYVPDVCGGDASPVALTEWKIRAIKLLILLDRRGAVHRSDMRALGISPSRWTERRFGYLDATPGGYVRGSSTPDLKAQHPRNWAEIEADFDTWNPYKDLA